MVVLEKIYYIIMSINFTTLAPIVATVATAGGLIFQIGTHSEKLGSLGLKVDALEKKEEYNNKLENGESVYIACFVGCTYHCG